MSQRTITAAVACAAGNGLMAATYGGVATIDGTGVTIIAISRCASLTCTAAAVIAYGTSVVIVAGDCTGCVAARSLGACAGAVVNS